MNVLEYNKKEDRYAKMTYEAVKKLWNDDKYTREGLKNIALLMLDWVEHGPGLDEYIDEE